MKMDEKRYEELIEAGKLFKLNLPSKFEDFQSGNGEGIWAVVDDPDLQQRLDDDEVIEQFVAYAANNSVYYPNITVGTPVIARQRGGNTRPIAEWEFLVDSAEADKNRIEILKKLGVSE